MTWNHILLTSTHTEWLLLRLPVYVCSVDTHKNLPKNVFFSECDYSSSSESRPPTVTSIMPTALQGSDVHSAHLSTNIRWGSRDTHVRHTAHAHTLGKRNRAWSNNPSVRLACRMVLLFGHVFHMVPCSFLPFFNFSLLTTVSLTYTCGVGGWTGKNQCL